MQLVEEKWSEILLTVKREHELTDISFNTWLKPLQIFSIQNNRIFVLVSSEQMGLTYINKKYYLPLKVAVAEIIGMEYEIEFVLPEQARKLKMPHPARQATTEEAERSNLNPNYTFDTFVVGNNNRFAQSASLAVAESPGEIYNPLFLYGGVGLGKTHLMHSIAHFILQKNPSSRILYVTSEEFTNEVIEAIRNSNNTAMTKFREKYRNIDVLLIDDVQFIIGKESTQEEFFHTFNKLYQDHKQMVFTSDRPPQDIKKMEDRLRSRFQGGMVTSIDPPDLETRTAILRSRAEAEHIEFQKEAIDYIASNVSENIRELEGAFVRVTLLASQAHTPITLELTQKALQDLVKTNNKKKYITIDEITRTVCQFYKVKYEDLMSKKKTKSIVIPRQIAMYLCRELTENTFPHIGTAFSGRDHTTVMHACNKVSDEIKSNESFRKMIEQLKTQITGVDK